MWNPLHFRADRPTKGWHKDTPRTSRKNRSQEPNCSNSFIRDQIVRSRSDRGDPILKEHRPAIQSRLRYDRVGEKHTRPVGWPHREATKDRWTEEAFVPIECAELRHTTRYGWPHREGLAPTTREGARRVFVPIEIWDKLDPTGWPHRERLQPSTRKVEEESMFRSRTETDSTRKGDLIVKTWRETEAESPKELRFITLEVRQMGEAGEHTPEPTNWRGSTTNGHSQSWDSSEETSRGPSMDARPAVMRQWPGRKATSQGSPQWEREQGETPTRTAQTPKCDGAREQSGPTGRLPASRSQKQPDDQTGEVKTREREPRQTPSENAQGKTGNKSIRTQSMEENWKTQPSWGTSKVSSRDGATGTDSNTPTYPEE